APSARPPAPPPSPPRRPPAAELQQLRRLLHATTDCRQWRRAEAVVLSAEGGDAPALARCLGLHPHTVHAYLHAFDRRGLDWVRRCGRGGAPARITAEQRAALCRLADQPPAVVGLPYGRWSLAKLRAYAIRRRLVKAISREHLRRVLQKGGSTFAASSGNSLAPTRSGPRSCGGCGRSGGTGRAGPPCCSSMSGWCLSGPTAVGVTPAPAAWSCPAARRRGASSTCFCSTSSTGAAAGGPSSRAKGRRMSADSCGGGAAGAPGSPSGGWSATTAPPPAN